MALGLNLIRMPGLYEGHIESFSVSEKQPRGVIHFRIVTALPFNGQGPDFTTGFRDFKLDEDSDQSFAGMAAICAKMANPGPIVGPQDFVRLEIHTGAVDEIDVLTII